MNQQLINTSEDQLTGTSKNQLTEKQKKLLPLILEGGNWRTSLDIAGYSPETQKSDILNSEAFRKAYLDGVETALLSNGARAVKALEDAMDDPTQAGTREKVKVATEFLDRMGLGKVERVKHEGVVTSAIFILPPKREAPSEDEAIVIEVTPSC